ncbi:MAG: hypothetical protein R2770_18020 [Acidimicrobiales bacterium]
MGSNEELRKTVQLDGGLEWGSTAAQPPEVKVVDFRATLPGIPELVVRFQGNQGSAELHIGHRCQLLRLTGKAPDRVTISGGAKGSVTLLEMVDLSARSNPSVHLSVGGQLEVESATALRSKVKVNLHVPSLVVQDSEVELVSVDGPTPPQVGVDGKSVLSGHSTASVFVNPCSKVECSATLRGEMLLAAESTVVLADGASLGTLKAAPGSAYPRVIASAVGNSNVGRSVRVLENVRLSSEGLGHVHVAERIE